MLRGRYKDTKPIGGKSSAQHTGDTQTMRILKDIMNMFHPSTICRNDDKYQSADYID